MGSVLVCFLLRPAKVSAKAPYLFFNPWSWEYHHRYGTSSHGGYGMGLERFLAWILKRHTVRECVPFPRYPGKWYEAIFALLKEIVLTMIQHPLSIAVASCYPCHSRYRRRRYMLLSMSLWLTLGNLHEELPDANRICHPAASPCCRMFSALSCVVYCYGSRAIE